MDPEEPPPAAARPPPCDCSCLCCCRSSAACRRSLKRKLDLMEAEVAAASMNARRDCHIAGEGEGEEEEVARVEIENEAAALREALESHQQSIQELYTELEEERNAAATAASEAMSMILRLQREKAEAQMEARQFKRFAEGKMAHDQQEIAFLEDLLFKREQAVQSLSCEVQAYKHCLLSYGIRVGRGRGGRRRGGFGESAEMEAIRDGDRGGGSAGEGRRGLAGEGRGG